jgi:ELWxxDGT repeat protein
LFLLASGAADKARALWRVEADGTVARLAPLCEGQATSTLPHSVFMELGSKVIFGCGNTGELWVSDGTPAGTTRLRESPGEDPGRRLDSGTALSKLGNLVLFPGYDIEHGWELWGTDGTKAGTQLVRDIVPGPESSNPAGFLAGNGAVYFSAWDPEHGRELWAATP